VKSLLGAIGSGYSELTQQDARAAAAAIDGLGPLRTAATRSRLPALVVIRVYADKINTLLALDDQVAAGRSDPALTCVGTWSRQRGLPSEEQAPSARQRS
jgi:hypothetical protein